MDAQAGFKVLSGLSLGVHLVCCWRLSLPCVLCLSAVSVWALDWDDQDHTCSLRAAV